MRILIIIAMVMISSVCLADDWADSLTESANMVKTNLNYSSTVSNAPNSVIFDYLREAYILLAPITYGEFMADTIEVVKNDFDYALDTALIEVNRVVCKYGDTLLFSINYLPFDEWANSQRKTTVGKKRRLAHPSYYDYNNGYIFFYPLPKLSEDTFVVYGFSKVVNIMTDSTFPSQVLQRYRPAAIAFATMRLASRNKLWTEAAWWRSEFDRLVALINNKDSQ